MTRGTSCIIAEVVSTQRPIIIHYHSFSHDPFHIFNRFAPDPLPKVTSDLSSHIFLDARIGHIRGSFPCRNGLITALRASFFILFPPQLLLQSYSFERRFGWDTGPPCCSEESQHVQQNSKRFQRIQFMRQPVVSCLTSATRARSGIVNPAFNIKQA